jgi:hypothetical protein
LAAAPLISPAAGAVQTSARPATGGLSLEGIGKIAQGVLKGTAKLFRGMQQGSRPSTASVQSQMTPEEVAGWAAYRAGEWSVATDGTILVHDPEAPVLNAELAAIPDLQILDNPLLVPSDYSLLSEHATASGITGRYSLNVDPILAFTPESTAQNYSLLAHEEMRSYLEALPPNRAQGFVDDTVSSTGYSQATILQGLNALGLLAGAFGVYQGIEAGDPLSILGGVAGVISNFTQLTGLGQLPGLSLLTSLLGIASGVMGGNWLGVVSGTIGLITGVVTLAQAGTFGAAAAALVITEVVTTVLSLLSIATIAVAVIGFMISNDLSKAAEQRMNQARETAQIRANMAVAWPQVVNGHKAALLLKFVPVLPPHRHIEALRAIFSATRIGLAGGAAVSVFLSTQGGRQGFIPALDVSAYEAVSGIYIDDNVIGCMRTEEALIRLGVLVEPGFYPFGILDPTQLMGWVAWGTRTFVQGGVDEYGAPIVSVPSGAALEPIVPASPDLGCVETEPSLINPAELVCVRYAKAEAGSGFWAKFWRGNEEEMLMAVVRYYNPTGWQQTRFGERLLFLGTYPVPLTPTEEATIREQYEYWRNIFYNTDQGSLVPDKWINAPRLTWITSYRIDLALVDPYSNPTGYTGGNGA